MTQLNSDGFFPGYGDASRTTFPVAPESLNQDPPYWAELFERFSLLHPDDQFTLVSKLIESSGVPLGSPIQTIIIGPPARSLSSNDMYTAHEPQKPQTS